MFGPISTDFNSKPKTRFAGVSILAAVASVGALLAVPIGCGKNAAPFPATASPSALAPKTVPGVQASLEGTWISNCVTQDNPGAGTTTSSKEKYVFTLDRQFSHTVLTFTDSTCMNSDKTSTISGTFSPDKPVQARFANAENSPVRRVGTRGDAVPLELVINVGDDTTSVGKAYTVERIEGQSLFAGFIPYDEAPEDSKDHVPAVDVSKEFKKQ